VQGDAKNDRSIHLSRKELRFLMELLGAPGMIGLEASADDPTVARPQAKARTLKEGGESLVARGMVRPGGTGEKDQVQGKLLRHTLPCFFPEKVLLMIRDLPEVGRQILMLFRRGESIVVHTFPDPGSHRFEELGGAGEAAGLILSLFPLQPQEVRMSGVAMPVQAFEALRQAAEARDEHQALKVLAGAPLAEDEKIALVRAIEHRAISGSFAMLTCRGDTIVDAQSLALVADPMSGWLISQPKNDPTGKTTGVERIAEFGRLAGTMAAWLTGPLTSAAGMNN
jgi:hypothetical protein